MKPASFARQTVCVVSLLAGVTVYLPASAAAYTIRGLGTSSWGGAYGINDSGQVVGWSGANAFLWSNGAMTDLGTVGGLTTSWAEDVNDNGRVVGTSFSPDDGPELPFLWSNGRMTALRTPAGWGGAVSINSSDQVVGWVYDQSYQRRAFLWSNGATTDLGTLGGGRHSFATAINDSGKVVGSSYTAGDTTHRAFLWSNGTMTDLGVSAGGDSTAYDINDSGQVVGGFSVRPGTGLKRAFLWSNGAITDLGTLGGEGSWTAANAVNDKGQIVGEANERAFLWHDGVMVDLNTLVDPASGWTLGGAQDINDAGQIVGLGTINGKTRGYLLTPVPEAGTYAYMAVGLGLVGWIARRRKAARSSSP